MQKNNIPSELKSEEVRRLIIKTAYNAKAGHITSSLSAVDILSVLYFDNILKHNSKNPFWIERDRFILSKAHAGLGLYTILALDGYYSISELKNYCKPGQHMGDHSNHLIPGVENSGGALGHGLGIAAGMALSSKIKRDKRLYYVLTGDGECQEGSIWEAAMMITNKHLDNLIWIIDYNGLQANSRINNTNDIEPLKEKLISFGFSVEEVDGHNHVALKHVLTIDRNYEHKKPLVIIAYTKKGYGIPYLEDKEDWHGKQPSEDEYIIIANQLEIGEEELKNFANSI